MTFKEKIDKILELNTLQIDSVSALEDEIGAGRGAINNFYNENREPGRMTLKRIKTLPGLNLDWWETGEGPVFIAGSMENHTGVQNGADNNEIPVGVNLDEESKKLLAIANKTTRYAFVPSTILDGEYRIELKSELDHRAIERRETIDALKLVIKKLEEEIVMLRSGQVVAAPQNTK